MLLQAYAVLEPGAAPRTIVTDQLGARLTRGNLTMPFSSLLDV
ncbi:hypothetical protein B0G71_4820 [Paraburkholderia sp. BL27I4N3]|nr:hypothetical protein B0G71_4820 [Paraburkholderia sp. BL27I4N3]